MAAFASRLLMRSGLETPSLPVLLIIMSADIHLKALVNWRIALPHGSRPRGAQPPQSAPASWKAYLTGLPSAKSERSTAQESSSADLTQGVSDEETCSSTVVPAALHELHIVHGVTFV